MSQNLYYTFCVLVLLNLHECQETSTIKCTSTNDCPKGSCCRNTDGHVLSLQPGFGRISFPLESESEGTCVGRLAQMGEICDSICDCDQNMTCYRPITGACCPPNRCYDSEYVRKQKAYWEECFRNPNCPLPP